MTSRRADLWTEIDAELRRENQSRGPKPTAGGDSDWLRRASYSHEVDAACEVVASRRGLHRVLVQGARSRSSEDALRSFGDALEFPSYYGQNYDAMDECLRELLIVTNGRLGGFYGDRIGRSARGIFLEIGSAHHFLDGDSGDRSAKFMSVLRRAAYPESDPLGRSEYTPTGLFYVLLWDSPN